jgi:hypothetical protein
VLAQDLVFHLSGDFGVGDGERGGLIDGHGSILCRGEDGVLGGLA